MWLEYFAAGPQADQFAAVIENVDALLVPAIVLADSIIYATAKQNQATVWTMDAHFAAFSNVRYVPKRP